jgi:hypothetical protein
MIQNDKIYDVVGARLAGNDSYLGSGIAAALRTKAGSPALMPQYLVANYLSDDFDPYAVTEAMIEEIHALNRESIAAGVRKFACGISPASNAKTVRKQPDGTVLVTDGHRGAQGRHLLRCSGRGARASFLPGSRPRTGESQ